MKYEASYYEFDCTTAIRSYSNQGDPMCFITINLSDYGIKPEDNNHIIIPAYKIADNVLKTVLTDLVEKVEREIFLGFIQGKTEEKKCLYVKLKDNWREHCV